MKGKIAGIILICLVIAISLFSVIFTEGLDNISFIEKGENQRESYCPVLLKINQTHYWETVETIELNNDGEVLK